MVFNIQRFSIHDGPGIRTTVFFKGCNLRCFWCHNPESINPQPQLQFFPQKCIGCGACFAVCPHQVHMMQDDQRTFVRANCVACGCCVEACYAESLVMAGADMTVAEVMSEVAKDQIFYETSDGGVTFSGGEPLLQLDFLMELLQESKARGYHTAIDTAGRFPWESLAAVMPLVDLILFDLKVMDGEKHRETTGVNNSQILANLRKLGQTTKEVWVRIPVIPGVNDNPQEITEMAKFLKGLPAVRLVELLPFHALGEGKYRSLGQEEHAIDLKPPSAQQLGQLVNILTDVGLKAQHS